MSNRPNWFPFSDSVLRHRLKPDVDENDDNPGRSLPESIPVRRRSSVIDKLKSWNTISFDMLPAWLR